MPRVSRQPTSPEPPTREYRLKVILLAATVVLVAIYALSLGGFAASGSTLLGFAVSPLVLAIAGLSVGATLAVILIKRRRVGAKKPVPAGDAPDAFRAIQGRTEFMATLARL